MKKIYYLDDLHVGQRFGSGKYVLDEAAIKRFATEYDPQPFHLDHAAAAKSFFQGLAASGWHTAAVTMRLFVDSEFKPAGGIIGAGLEALQWHQPVRPGDELSVETEILELRPSRSRPQQGMVKARVTTYNQRKEPVQIFVARLLVERFVP
ncbi:MaoC family dehydratase [Azonexus sp. R2A61]|uniref:MaoC family dehydratase n=1 Tax=Azonexus sp. R2A61 TaxID=2744443 RepID=UPI001F161877|nr:MaoC family dehydratase [Azonexus sp. R2A61]